MVNGVLAKFDVAATRRSTLERTRLQLGSALAEIQSLKASSTELVQGERALAEARLHQISESQQQALREMRREIVRYQIAGKWSVIDAMDRAVVPSAPVRTCPLCGHEGADDGYRRYTTNCIFGGGILERYQCPECDVVFGADKMFKLSRQELSQEYEWHYKVYEEGDSTEAELRAFHSLNPRRDGVYVNYGAGGWSRSVQLLRQEGWDVFAYEPHGSASTGGDWVITSEAEMASRRFDGLFSNNVLEHLRYPVEDFQRMMTWLNPGALMAHATPCYEYLYEYTRFHLFFFLGRSRELLAQRSGLSIQNYEVDGHYMNCVFASAAQ
jgi:hypothetical protein